MLPAYIIDDILERERRRSQILDELIDSPDIEPPRPKGEEGEATTERGVAIIDFTI
jgi:hypothetical protein